MIAQMKSDPESFFADSLNNFRFRNNPRVKQIPDPSDFEAIQLKNAVNYYNQRFNTANGMNYFFVGSIPEAQFKSLVETYIGGLNGTAVENKSKDLKIDPITGDKEFKVMVGSEPKSMVMEVGFFDTPYLQKDELALNLLGEVINNRITDTIREKMSAIYSGGMGMRLQKFPKERFSMQSYLPCGPENAQKVRVAFADILRMSKQAGSIKDAEISKAVESSIQKYRVGVKTNNYWLASLSKYQQYGLPGENILNFETRLKSVTPAMLTAAANKYLSSPNMVHALLMPASN